MPTFNRKFDLDPQDIDLIETALRQAAGTQPDQAKGREIQELLGKIHNQKIFYRPVNKTYVSG